MKPIPEEVRVLAEKVGVTLHGEIEPEPIQWNPDILTKGQVAKRLSLSPRCVEYMMQRRQIPFIRLSPRCVRYHWPSVMAAMDKFTVRAVA